MSSTAGLVGYPGIAGYVASKWAVRGLTKTAALEFGPYGIRVNSIHPGQTRTAMTSGMPEPTQPLARSADPAEIASVVTFLASNAASSCTGPTTAPASRFSGARPDRHPPSRKGAGLRGHH